MRKSMITSMFLFTLVFSLFTGADDVNAGAHGGSGGSNTSSGGNAGWYTAGGDPATGDVSPAWKEFQKAHSADSYKIFTRTGEWEIFPPKGLSKIQFYNTCRKSQFIWWYGNKSKFYTQVGSVDRPEINSEMPHAPGQWNYMSKYTLKQYSNKTSNMREWNRKPGGTVVVCSHGITQPTPLNIKANSGVFVYDGKKKTVSGIKNRKAVVKKLKKGHSLTTVTASGSRTNVTSKNGHKNLVKFTKNAVIRDGKTNVTGLYSITHTKGDLKILPRLPGKDKRCKTTTSHSAKTVFKNDVTIVSGSDQGEMTQFADTYSRTNKANTNYKNRPKVEDSKAKWNSWSKEFKNNGKDLDTKVVNIRSISKKMMETGGILNVTRTHHYAKVDIDLCQPQKATQVPNEDGTAAKRVWKDVGKEEIESLVAEKKGSKQSSYQILGVNCNAEGFKQVKEDFDTIDLSAGNGTASGLLETKETAGTKFPLGKKSHYTGKDKFFNPDGKSDGLGNKWKNSCQETFKKACISDKLTGSDVKNNADYNVGENPLFTYKDGAEHGSPSSDGEINFFRDNEKRTVRADVWYPKEIKTNDFKTYPERAAKNTVAKVFGGTPEIDVTTIAPWDEPGGKIEEMNKAKKWDRHVNSVIMRSKWSSDKGNPYELGLNWNYEADASQNIATDVDGYKVIDKEQNTKGMDLYCQFMNDGSKSENAQVPENPFKASEVNKLDWNENNSIKTLFTRSVSGESSNSEKLD